MVLLSGALQNSPIGTKLQALEGWGLLLKALAQHAPSHLAGMANQVSFSFHSSLQTHQPSLQLQASLQLQPSLQPHSAILLSAHRPLPTFYLINSNYMQICPLPAALLCPPPPPHPPSLPSTCWLSLASACCYVSACHVDTLCMCLWRLCHQPTYAIPCALQFATAARHEAQTSSMILCCSS